jgi:hypothetical protein
MNRKLQLMVAGALFVFAGLLQGQAQNLVQPLTVNLTAYDSADGHAIRIGTAQFIRYLTGSDVTKGRLVLVTPPGNTPGTIGALGSFLRITSGNTTVLEIPSPGEFNLYQDYAALTTRGSRTSGKALNRFSIDSGSVRGELQGFSTWTIRTEPVRGTDVSGTGTFASKVNGWLEITDVTQGTAVVTGTIAAGAPRAEEAPPEETSTDTTDTSTSDTSGTPTPKS